MTPENFCYWLQGLFELAEPEELYPDQVKMIKEHLGYVFERKAVISAPLTAGSIWSLPMTQPCQVTNESADQPQMQPGSAIC